MIVNGFGNETILNSHIPIDIIRRRKEQLKQEIQDIREKIAQCDVQMSMMQFYTDKPTKPGNRKK